MYLKQKIKYRLLILLLILFAFIYWRGIRAVAKESNLDCNYHVFYAVCKQIGKATTLPTFWDVLKAGVKF